MRKVPRALWVLGATLLAAAGCEGGGGADDRAGVDDFRVADDAPLPEPDVPGAAADPDPSPASVDAADDDPADVPPPDVPRGCLEATPKMVDFGMNAVGVPAQRLLTLASVGAGPVTVTAFRIDGQDAALFRIEPDAGPAAALAAGTPLVLAPSESAQVAVGFTFQGNRQAVGATLVLQTDGDPAEVAVQLAGLGQVGFDCHPVFVPALVTFGQVLVGTAQDLPLVLRNQGNGECEIFQPRLQACAVSGESGIATCDEPTKGPSSASFELVDAPPSTMVLQGQQSWPMTVRFDPAGAGTVAALVGVMVRDPQTKKTMRLPEPGPDGGWSPNVIGLGVLPNPP